MRGKEAAESVWMGTTDGEESLSQNLTRDPVVFCRITKVSFVVVVVVCSTTTLSEWTHVHICVDFMQVLARDTYPIGTRVSKE